MHSFATSIRTIHCMINIVLICHSNYVNDMCIFIDKNGNWNRFRCILLFSTNNFNSYHVSYVNVGIFNHSVYCLFGPDSALLVSTNHLSRLGCLRLYGYDTHIFRFAQMISIQLSFICRFVSATDNNKMSKISPVHVVYNNKWPRLLNESIAYENNL